ncbi:hypothetical protein RGQ15_05805 [Paracoccus sp. MBLB3053]|uniref:Uncharacterized protein n=1 Tax=Paracoccus aurantius TaxID=3073814 RepID=A0ABU2HS17_9RHOB|nr:hypothetical protein [Paracoccus sp. MBLB3053]MDS9467089.1 hypothetical protein [Paracoccus sp. MBLB3053]
MGRAVRLILRTVGGLWSLVMILLMVTSLALSVAMTLVPQVLGAVASVVEAVTGRRSVVTETHAREARLNERIARQGADLDAERAARRAETRALRAQLADNTVQYRGRRIAMREAVHDTAERVSRRTGAAAARNVGSTFGEALPVIGVGVIAAATAWELHDACALMQEMRELDAAFNPDEPVTEDEVCGISPPSRDEVWQAVKTSPAAAWHGAQGLYDDLPEVSISASYDWTLGKLSGIWHWFEDDAAAYLPASVE